MSPKSEKKIAVCCVGKLGDLYEDPVNKQLHTKDCISKEIDWLMNHCAPDSINKMSGLPVRERIEQLSELIQ